MYAAPNITYAYIDWIQNLISLHGERQVQIRMFILCSIHVCCPQRTYSRMYSILQAKIMLTHECARNERVHA